MNFSINQEGWKEMKIKLLLACGLFLAGFLLGFIPQNSKVWNSRSELAVAKQDLASCQFGGKLLNARDLLAMSYLEANRKNYGIASDYSSRFFNQVQQLVGEAHSGNIQSVLQEALSSRDIVISALARGDPDAASLLESLLLKTYPVTPGS
jgi:hypothetical protein